jgi:disulfide bond formation protein DsbB
LGKLISDVRNDFWKTLGRWQTKRPLWLLGGLSALSLEIFSVVFFQNFLNLDPCELCVLIRFSMLAICAGGLIAAINPGIFLLRATGYIIVIWGIARGLIWDIRLEIENLRPAAEHSVCSMSAPQFPFGLPLDRWFPAHFTPMALCGDAGNYWSFLGLNMPEWLFPVYGAFAVGIFLMLAAGLKRRP